MSSMTLVGTDMALANFWLVKKSVRKKFEIFPRSFGVIHGKNLIFQFTISSFFMINQSGGLIVDNFAFTQDHSQELDET